MSNTPRQYRHGDLLVIEVTDPKELAALQAAKNKTMEHQPTGLILVGEGLNHGHYATGSVDLFLESDIADVTRPDIGFMTVGADGKLQHLNTNDGKWTNEHPDIVLPPNTTWRIRRQREHDATRDVQQLVRD